MSVTMSEKLDAFGAYQKYTAIKLHFNSESYDYFKYRGSTRVSRTNFETQKDRYQYHKLAQRYPRSYDLEMFLAACFLASKTSKVYVRDLFDDEYQKIGKSSLKHLQSLTYMFRLELESCQPLDETLVVVDGDYPKLLKMFNRGEISAQSLIVFDATCQIFDYWDSAISDRIVWPRIKNRLEAYAPFMNIALKDKAPFAEMIRNT